LRRRRLILSHARHASRLSPGEAGAVRANLCGDNLLSPGCTQDEGNGRFSSCEGA